MTPTLSVVADNVNLEPAREVLADRIKRLQAEAKGLAREHVQALEEAISRVHQMAVEIAEGGDAYAVGVRELARRLAEDCEHRVQTLEAITSRG
jgi:enoyl-CoA hydratase/carnithine racemase